MAGRSSDVRAWLSAHHGRDGRGRGRDVSWIRPVVEGRLICGELLRLLDQLGMILDGSGAQVAGAKVGVVEARSVGRDRRRGPDDDELAEGASRARDRPGSSRAAGAARAAERAACAVLSIAAASWASDSTTFIPVPPPPPDGLSITGKPILRASSSALAGSTAPLPGVTGTPLMAASRRAASLEPSARMADAGGPMNLIPAASHASGNAGFSARKP